MVRAASKARTVGSVALDELIPLALDDLGPGGHDVVVRLPEDLPDCLADAALPERVAANLIANALRHSPPGNPPLLSASTGIGRERPGPPTGPAVSHGQ
jgi:two-component system, OmpR family, sensor histidine kinase KdpD